MWALAAIATYAAVLAMLAVLNRKEFLRCPEKGERYRVLPLPYKFACWFGVVPLFVAAAFVHGALFFAAIAAYAAVEILCVRWYEKHGLLQLERTET